MSLVGGLSLRRKVPLLVSSLAAGALLIAGWLAYEEVRGSAWTSAQSRLESISQQLVELTAANEAERDLIAAEVVESPEVRRALRGLPADTLRLAGALDRLRTYSDGNLPVRLLTADGQTVLELGGMRASIEDPEPTPMVDSTGVGRLRQVGNDFIYWTTIPVPSADGDILGTIAQRRRVSYPEIGIQRQALIGRNVHISVGQRGHGVWARVGGVPHETPEGALPLGRTFTFTRDDGTEALAIAQPLAGEWIGFFEMSTDDVLERPRVFARRMLLVGAIIIFATILISSIMSRRLTEPLLALVSAADGVAGGDYGHRVSAVGKDELARLGRAFNTMSEQVARSHEELRERLEEARSLSLRLVEANLAAEHARDEAQAANRAKSDFLATMSHELRTPINAVIGYNELLSAGIPDAPTDQQREFMERIGRSSRRLVSLVNDVLDLSRIESGQIRVGSQRGWVSEPIRAAIEVIEPDAAAKGVELAADCAGQHTFVGDQGRVQQILVNLVANAVKFTPRGGTVTVQCSHDPDGPPAPRQGGGPWTRVDVADTGIGIDPNQLSSIFEPFVQAGPSLAGKYRGVGLGLAISRRLARMMSGDITVTSSRGEGSCFTLWLPGAASEHEVAI